MGMKISKNTNAKDVSKINESFETVFFDRAQIKYRSSEATNGKVQTANTSLFHTSKASRASIMHCVRRSQKKNRRSFFTDKSLLLCETSGLRRSDRPSLFPHFSSDNVGEI